MNETLFKSNILGRDGFIWWIGRVADPSVWKKTNDFLATDGKKQQRVKVRIIGYHPWDNTLPEKDLPWAEVMQDPQVGSGQGGIGESMSLQGGETAVGFFLDGEEAQQPVIFGLLNRNQDVTSSVSPEELKTNQTSAFKTWTPEKVKPTQKDSTYTLENPTSVVPKKAAVSDAQSAAERLYTKPVSIPSTCGDDAISRISQQLNDFIELTSGLEEGIDNFIDPVVGEIVDIEKKIKNLVKEVKGHIKGILNEVRKNLIGKLNLIFGKFLGTLKKINPFSFITDAAAKLGLKNIVKIIFCNFENAIGGLDGFLKRMFNNLVGKVINGPLCAVEQFTSGILAKVFDKIEGLLGPIMGGLNWLTGGLGAVKGVLKKASSLATAIYNFIGCDGPKCSTPSKWVSSFNASMKTKSDDWGDQVKNMNIFTGISSSLAGAASNVKSGISSAFGEISTDEIKPFNYNGTDSVKILSTVDKLTGGDSAGTVTKGLGSIESALATMSLFGGENSIFNACNNSTNDPKNQDDIGSSRPGYKYNKCIPPEPRIVGLGTGADVMIVVGNNSTIFSIEVVDGGSGYDSDTTIAIVDNSGYGSGAQALPIIKDGVIEKVVMLNRGYGYCGGNLDGLIGVGVTGTTGISTVGTGTTSGVRTPDTFGIADTDVPPIGTALDDRTGTTTGTGIGTGTVNTGIGTDVYGVVVDIFVDDPGRGYDPDDRVTVCRAGICTYVRPDLTKSGHISNVPWPPLSWEFDTPPEVTIETKTGFGAELIPIMSYNIQYTRDITDRKPLIGITTVIDCPPEDHKF